MSTDKWQDNKKYLEKRMYRPPLPVVKRRRRYTPPIPAKPCTLRYNGKDLVYNAERKVLTVAFENGAPTRFPSRKKALHAIWHTIQFCNKHKMTKKNSDAYWHTDFEFVYEGE